MPTQEMTMATPSKHTLGIVVDRIERWTRANIKAFFYAHDVPGELVVGYSKLDVVVTVFRGLERAQNYDILLKVVLDVAGRFQDDGELREAMLRDGFVVGKGELVPDVPQAEENRAGLEESRARAVPPGIHENADTQGVSAGGPGSGKIKVLFLAANPDGTDTLALGEEARAITERIRAAKHRDRMELVTRWAVRPEDLLQALNEHRPHVVHFSGHGSKKKEIFLHDANNQPQAVSREAMRGLFAAMKDNVRVVVFNACFSESQAEVVTEVIDCAVGMSRAVSDQAAIIFAASFYSAIGFGGSVQQAFDQGKAALLLKGIPEDQTPRLLTRTGVDPAEVFLIRA